jgi:hypothetical protein
MDAGRYWWTVILLAVALALTGCAGNSAEVEAAKAEYIQAKAHSIEAEAHKAEQEAALLEQQRELARDNAALASDLRRQRQQALIEIGKVVITGGLIVGPLLAMLHALHPLIRTWTEQRVRLLQIEAPTLAQRIRWAELERSRLKHERILLEARAQDEAEQQETLRLQVQLTQAQAQRAREQRWLEHTRRAQGVPLEHKATDGNGRQH